MDFLQNIKKKVRDLKMKKKEKMAMLLGVAASGWVCIYCCTNPPTNITPVSEKETVITSLKKCNTTYFSKKIYFISNRRYTSSAIEDILHQQ